MSLSQRTFSFVLVAIMFLMVGIYATSQHLLPPIHDLVSNAFTLVTPLLFVFTTLNAWFDNIDTLVASGQLKPGELTPLFTMSAFYVFLVAELGGVLQIFSVKVLDADTQAMIVNVLLIMATVLLRSFTERPAQQAAKPLALPPAA